jgi:predicted DNA-binding transcriptional regulator AlpA
MRQGVLGFDLVDSQKCGQSCQRASQGSPPLSAWACRPEEVNAMNEYQFTLVTAADLDDEATVDALFEAGCDDATLGSVDGVGYADFVRAGDSFGEAVRSAIQQVESVPGLKVIRVEPDDLVTMSEIAERMGRTRESVRLLIRGARGPGGFPPPVSHLKSRSRFWRWSDVSAWASRIGLEELETRQAQLVAAINAALILRDKSPKLGFADQNLVRLLIGNRRSRAS